MEDSVNKKDIRHNLAFTIYFTIMFCFYTFTYIQLAAQIGIIAYVVICIIKNPVIDKEKIKNIVFFIIWFGIFTFLMYLSKFWAYSIAEGSKTMLTTFRIFIIGLIMFFYIDSKEKAIAVLKSFIIAILIMGIVAMVVTPISEYGKEGDGLNYGFGTRIGQHRNQIGAVAATMFILCFYLKEYYNFKYGRIVGFFLVLLTFITGSRSSVVQIAIILVLRLLLDNDKISNKVKRVIRVIPVIILILLLIHSVPFFYNTIWLRVEKAIITTIGNDVADTSTLGRREYKNIAFIMFKNRPFVGFGIDGFKCYLRDNSYIMGRYLQDVYSHCNYAEIAADFGVLGLLIWYIPILYIVINMFKIRKKSDWTVCILSVFLSMIILDIARIPWTTHLEMYMMIVIIMLCRFEIYEKRNENKDESLEENKRSMVGFKIFKKNKNTKFDE